MNQAGICPFAGLAAGMRRPQNGALGMIAAWWPHQRSGGALDGPAQRRGRRIARVAGGMEPPLPVVARHDEVGDPEAPAPGDTTSRHSRDPRTQSARHPGRGRGTAACPRRGPASCWLNVNALSVPPDVA